ncbi:hypothetical protein ACFCYH_40860 [Streptomyces sp. NPDC056400]|uniref:hypothetical protein n=1 Tax=Streptomyces sp. NPDC056400 TaxID=3345808 RepID=UPI0035DD35A2
MLLTAGAGGGRGRRAPPEHRRRLRSWRRTRPFWGGLLVLVPHSSFPAPVSLGWSWRGWSCGSCRRPGRTSPRTPSLLLPALPFGATNPGGFLVGMALGIAGSSLAFDWPPLPEEDPAAEGPVAGVPRYRPPHCRWCSCWRWRRGTGGGGRPGRHGLRRP